MSLWRQFTRGVRVLIRRTAADRELAAAQVMRSLPRQVGAPASEMGPSLTSSQQQQQQQQQQGEVRD